MRITSFLRSLLSLTGFVAVCSAYTNPIRQEWGADPTITHADDAYYYLLSTFDVNVQLTRATTIEGLKTGEKKVVYSSDDPNRCCNNWAPEMHLLGGNWYIYFTSGRGSDLDGQRSHVLAGGASPWDGFEYAGAIVDTEWAIDGTVLETEAFGNFFVYSCFHGRPFQSICIQPLNDDYVSVRGEVRIISEPEQPWETNAHPVNEGPFALYLNGVTYISYSASYCWSPTYCLGLLTWDGTTDPTDRAAWTKSNGCVMSTANGHFSTGHNSFLTIGDDHWVVYHAVSNPNGGCDQTRYTMMQPLEVNDDGTPRFQTPAPFSQEFPDPSL